MSRPSQSPGAQDSPALLVAHARIAQLESVLKTLLDTLNAEMDYWEGALAKLTPDDKAQMVAPASDLEPDALAVAMRTARRVLRHPPGPTAQRSGSARVPGEGVR